MRAVTLDFWDTLYDSGNLPERLAFRQEAIRTLLGQYGVELAHREVMQLYTASAREAERWWRDEHRGYTTAERLHWMLERVGLEPRPDCGYVASACDAVDAALLRWPPPLLPGAADAVRALAAHVPLGIISDTGFASGRAQNALLEQDGLRHHFGATVYSMDVGHAKPHAEPFTAAVRALAVSSPKDVVHVGDNERTDVGGALAAGLRAIRLDVVRLARSSGFDSADYRDDASAAEFVAESFAELVGYLSDCGLRTADTGAR